MRWTWFVVPVMILAGCGESPTEKDPCEKVFVPYPDMISQRTRTHLNATYVDGMAFYSRGEYVQARDSITKFLDVQRADLTGYIYLACTYLALGDPYKAELQLDHLEKSNILQYNDQVEWYTVVCHVCSGQLERARTGAEAIVAAKTHTYSKEARKLLADLPGSR